MTRISTSAEDFAAAAGTAATTPVGRFFAMAAQCSQNRRGRQCRLPIKLECIPVIMLTGFGVTEGSPLFVDWVLSKPTTIDELRRMITEVTGGKAVRSSGLGLS